MKIVVKRLLIYYVAMGEFCQDLENNPSDVTRGLSRIGLGRHSIIKESLGVHLHGREVYRHVCNVFRYENDRIQCYWSFNHIWTFSTAVKITLHHWSARLKDYYLTTLPC